MRASCQNGHERRRMEMDHMRQVFVCPGCGQQVTPEAIDRSTPEAYRAHRDPVVTGLQRLLDYEVEGVVRAPGRITIEYPRNG